MKTIPLKLAGQVLVLNIEAPRGRYRIKNGEARRYAADYGEIADTKGADGEPVDVYWGGLGKRLSRQTGGGDGMIDGWDGND